MSNLTKIQKRIILITNIIFIFLILLFDFLYYGLKFTGMSHDIRVSFKWIASILFVVECITNIFLGIYFVRKGHKLHYPLLMLVGQFFACLGDIVLGIHFITGALLFAIGHIFFLIAFFIITGFSKRDIICIGASIVFSIIFLLVYPYFDFGGIDWVVYLYAVIVSTLLGKGISVLLSNEDKILRILIFIGATCFYISDFMLVLSQFGGGYEITDALCLLFYYPAECALALSTIAYFVKDTN